MIEALDVLEHFRALAPKEARRVLALARALLDGRTDNQTPGTGSRPAEDHGPAPGAPLTETPQRRARGVRHGAAKLTEGDVHEIRRRYKGPLSCETLASDFGVSHTTVRNIVHRRTWKHLAQRDGEYVPRVTDGKNQRTGRTRLSPDAVRAIRREYRTDTVAEIASRYAISETHVVGIANRSTWASLAPRADEYVPDPSIEGTQIRRPDRDARRSTTDGQPPPPQPTA